MIKKFLISLFSEDGSISSKRFFGGMAATSLCIALLVDSFSSKDVKISDVLIQSVAFLASASLGISAWQTIKTNKNGTEKTGDKDS